MAVSFGGLQAELGDVPSEPFKASFDNCIFDNCTNAITFAWYSDDNINVYTNSGTVQDARQSTFVNCTFVAKPNELTHFLWMNREGDCTLTNCIIAGFNVHFSGYGDSYDVPDNDDNDSYPQRDFTVFSPIQCAFRRCVFSDSISSYNYVNQNALNFDTCIAIGSSVQIFASTVSYTLSSENNPCVNAGISQQHPLDFDGTTRVLGGSIDIGAQEMNSN